MSSVKWLQKSQQKLDNVLERKMNDLESFLTTSLDFLKTQKASSSLKTPRARRIAKTPKKSVRQSIRMTAETPRRPPTNQAAIRTKTKDVAMPTSLPKEETVNIERQREHQSPKDSHNSPTSNGTFVNTPLKTAAQVPSISSPSKKSKSSIEEAPPLPETPSKAPPSSQASIAITTTQGQEKKQLSKYESWTTKIEVKHKTPLSQSATTKNEQQIKATPTQRKPMAKTPKSRNRRRVKTPKVKLIDDIPAESPLTKAKKADSQNIWREKQLKSFLESSTLSSSKVPNLETSKNKFLGGKEANKNISVKEESNTEISLLERVQEEDIIHIDKQSTSPPTIASKTNLIESPKDVDENIESIFEEEMPSAMTKKSSMDIFDFDAVKSKSTQNLSKKQPNSENQSTKVTKQEEAERKNEASKSRIPSLKPSNVQSKNTSLDTKVISSSKASSLYSKTVPLNKHAVSGNKEETLKERLKERNEKAIAKRKELFEKAQQLKAQKSGKPPPTTKRTSPLAPSTPVQKKNLLNKVDLVKDPTPTKPPPPPSTPNLPDCEDTKPQNNKPQWANTPALALKMREQRSMKPEDIFGEIEPVKLEDFFKNSGRDWSRSRKSSFWHK